MCHPRTTGRVKDSEQDPSCCAQSCRLNSWLSEGVSLGAGSGRRVSVTGSVQWDHPMMHHDGALIGFSFLSGVAHWRC